MLLTATTCASSLTAKLAQEKRTQCRYAMPLVVVFDFCRCDLLSVVQGVGSGDDEGLIPRSIKQILVSVTIFTDSQVVATVHSETIFVFVNRLQHASCACKVGSSTWTRLFSRYIYIVDRPFLYFSACFDIIDLLFARLIL